LSSISGLPFFTAIKIARTNGKQGKSLSKNSWHRTNHPKGLCSTKTSHPAPFTAAILESHGIQWGMSYNGYGYRIGSMEFVGGYNTMNGKYALMQNKSAMKKPFLAEFRVAKRYRSPSLLS
jgi:hypothetical protein